MNALWKDANLSNHSVNPRSLGKFITRNIDEFSKNGIEITKRKSHGNQLVKFIWKNF